jgi:tripartite ATP-independent transporter DctM subunit
LILFSLVILFACLFIGLPVCVAFLATAFYFLMTGDYDTSFMIPYGANKMGSTLLFAIPMFIMAGGIIEKGNIGDKLIGLVENFVGRIRGGLGVITVISCALFGSITGSACATLSCIGSIMLPRMRAANYPMGHVAALLASSSILGLLIPPSGIMIIYAWMGGQSVLASLLAIVAPGLLLAFLLSVINLFLLRNEKGIILATGTESGGEMKIAKRKKLLGSIPAVLLPVVVLGGIYGGFMTPTEAAAVSVLYAILIGMFVYRGLTWRNLKECIIEGSVTSGSIMIMIFCVMMLSRVYIMEDLPSKILALFRSISEDKHVLLFMINIFMLIMGMLMDDTSAVLLCTPILVPIVKEIGVDPIQFAAIVAVNLGLGNITPPCAPLLYMGSSVVGVPITKMIRPTLVMILFGWLPVLAITTYWPGFALFIPHLVLGN